MIRNTLKLNHGTFEYYILQVCIDTNLDEIQCKFSQFNTFEDHNKNIVLDFDNKFDFENISNLILNINDIAKVHGINIHSIIENESIRADSVFGIPVINLPKKAKTQQHIYNKSIIIDEPVRSGIKIENDGDIIVTSFVSDNAEIVANGNIHVYGDARGRLIAGADGNKQARIFAQSFNPELISIAGIYRTIETELPPNIMRKSVMVSLDEKDRLLIIPFSK